MKKGLIILIFSSLLLSGCSTQNFSDTPVNKSNPDQGVMIWDAESAQWKLQCPNPNDYAYVGGAKGYVPDNLKEAISANENKCAELGSRISLPDEFSAEIANSEVASYIKYNPDKAECEVFIKYRIGKNAREKIQMGLDQIQSTLDLIALDPFAQGTLTAKLNLATERNKLNQKMGEASYYFYQFSDEAENLLKVAKDRAQRCNFSKEDLA